MPNQIRLGMAFFFPVPISQRPLKVFSVKSLQILGILGFCLQFLFNFWLFIALIIAGNIKVKRSLFELGASLGSSICCWGFVSLLTIWIFSKKSKAKFHLLSCGIIQIFLFFLQLIYLRFLLFEELLPQVYMINDLFVNGTSSVIGVMVTSADFGAYLLATKRRHSMKIKEMVILSGYIFIGAFTIINITCTPLVWFFSENSVETIVFFVIGAIIFLVLLGMEVALHKREFDKKKMMHKQVGLQTERDQNPNVLIQYTTETGQEGPDTLKPKSTM